MRNEHFIKAQKLLQVHVKLKVLSFSVVHKVLLHIRDTFQTKTYCIYCLCTQSVEVSLLVSVELLEVDVGPLGVLLLRVFVQRILVAEDEVQLVVLATLVWSKHDAVGCTVVELLLQRRRNKGLT